MQTHKKLLLMALLIALAIPSYLYFTKAQEEISCEEPMVLYEGECIDFRQPCTLPPENSMPTSCQDWIIDGVRVERYQFTCYSDYARLGDECVKAIQPCTEIPAHAIASTCYDKIENNERIKKYTFSCENGYFKEGDQCIFSGDDSSYIYEEKVKITKWEAYEDSIKLWTKEYITGPKDYYFAYCKNGDDDSTAYHMHPHHISSNNELLITPLSENTEYTCYASIAREMYPGNYLYIQRSEPLKIKTGTKEELFHTFKINSDPQASSYGVLNLGVNDEVLFTHKTDTNYTIDYSSSKWSWDKTILDCREISSEELKCTATSTGEGNVSAKETIYVNSEPVVTTESNVIKVFVKSKIDEDPEETQEKKPSIPTSQPEPPAGYEEEVRTSSDNPFSDTTINSLAGQAAADLYDKGIIGGYPDGEFKGYRPVNRAEAAKFLLLSAGIEVKDLKNNGRFSDVIEGEWYTKYVMTAAERYIINGYSDGSFRPANTVNTAEFLKMLTLAFGLQTNLYYSYEDVSGDVWFAPYAGTAQKYNLFPNRDSYLMPGNELTREEVAIAIYQYLSSQ
ncbi:S-layer homology domain-containing protein [Candidatus Peregrinibacteria bacterium]|nr:S-layer homology domain-containing protein [Candidatus Peregrinibacteria bacterium]